MCANVSPQQPGSGEGLPTRAAHTGECVRADVHLQRTQTGVLFGTVLAVKGGSGDGAGGSCGLRAGGAVRELVAGQASRAATGLPALGALGAVGVRVWAGRVGGAAVVLLSTAGAAAGRRAQVQRPGRRRGAGGGRCEGEG